MPKRNCSGIVLGVKNSGGPSYKWSELPAVQPKARAPAGVPPTNGPLPAVREDGGGVVRSADCAPVALRLLQLCRVRTGASRGLISDRQLLAPPRPACARLLRWTRHLRVPAPD